MDITIDMIKQLREETGAGILDCRKALEMYGGDMKAAGDYLREKGLAAAQERSERKTSEGLVEVYGHPGNRVGVMVEVNCETDFVAKTDDFRSLAHELALHIAFAAPRYISREVVPAEVIEAQRAAFRAQALAEGKPEHIVERIVAGKMDKFFQETCLLEQPFVKDEDRKVDDIIKDRTIRLGENIVVRRFVRYELGEEL